jgi:hypothetical protein
MKKAQPPLGDKILTFAASVRITVVCLILLFILTFWGSVAQVTHGLYAAQERFFYSFFFLAAGFIPFPGAQLVLWVLFVNLVAAGFNHFINMRQWRHAGTLIIHFGILIYFVAAFVTFHATQEANLRFTKGETSNVAESYHEWELAYWKEDGVPRKVTAIDTTTGLNAGETIKFPDMTVTVEQYCRNCAAFVKTLPADGIQPLNSSGITMLQARDLFNEPEKNMAGIMFKVNGQRVLLFGGDMQPTKVGDYYMALRHKHFPCRSPSGSINSKRNSIRARKWPRITKVWSPSSSPAQCARPAFS